MYVDDGQTVFGRHIVDRLKAASPNDTENDLERRGHPTLRYNITRYPTGAVAFDDQTHP
jgi:hypothetical protein